MDFSVVQSQQTKKQVYTVENVGNDSFCESFCFVGNKITKVGSLESIENFCKENGKIVERIVLTPDQIVLPGFIDSHVHLFFGGLLLNSLNLGSVRSEEEFVEIIKEYSKTKKEGEWIIGYNVKFVNLTFNPNRQILDEISTDFPIVCLSFDLHSAIMNTFCLEKICGFDSSTRIEGGEIDVDSEGSCTGIVKDLALVALMKKLPMENSRHYIKTSMEEITKCGITSVTDMGSIFNLELNWVELLAKRELEKNGELQVRIYQAIGLRDWEKLQSELLSSIKNEEEEKEKMLRLGLLKEFFDGSLGSSTMLMMDEYKGRPGYHGLQVSKDEVVLECCKGAYKCGLQVAIHAIGDQAVRKLINIYKEVFINDEVKNKFRFRIEHAQHIQTEDILALKDLEILPCMNPAHIPPDLPQAKKVLSENAFKTIHREKEMMDLVKNTTFASDYPVMPMNIFEAIFQAMGRGCSLEQSLRAFTINGAFQMRMEDNVGSIKEGKFCDFVVVDRNIFLCERSRKLEDLRNTIVQSVYLNGKKIM